MCSPDNLNDKFSLTHSHSLATHGPPTPLTSEGVEAAGGLVSERDGVTTPEHDRTS